MAKVHATERVLVDRVMKYSGREEMWDFPAGEDTEVPDEVANELVPQHADKLAIVGPPSSGGGLYANRMMTTGATFRQTCPAVTKTGNVCGQPLPCRYKPHRPTEDE
jgi:hypothetical protein